MPALLPGQPAPTFRLQGLEGETFSLENMKPNEVAVLAFYKQTCPVCVFAFPWLDKIYRHHRKDAHIRFFAVAQEEKEGARRFAQTCNLAMPQALEPAPYHLSNAFGLTNVPTVFVVNAEGVIEQTIVGFVKAEYESLAERLGSVAEKTAISVFLGAEVPELRPG